MTTNELVNADDLFYVKKWDGSVDQISFYSVSKRSWEISDEIAKFLVSSKPNFFPMVDGKSVPQQFAWMSEQNNIYNQGGYRLIARHSFHEHYPIIGVMMVEYLPKNRVTVVVEAVGYEGQTVSDIFNDKAEELIQISGRKLITWEDWKRE